MSEGGSKLQRSFRGFKPDECKLEMNTVGNETDDEEF